MSLAVDNPILNNPFKEPREYWIYDEGQPKRMSGEKGFGKNLERIIAGVREGDIS